MKVGLKVGLKAGLKAGSKEGGDSDLRRESKQPDGQVTIRKNTSASGCEKVFRFQEWRTQNEWIVIKPSQAKRVNV